MKRTHIAIVTAVAAAALAVVVAVSTSGESCDAWHDRYQQATEDIVGTTGAAKDNAVRAWLDTHDDRPKGCEL